MAKYILKSAAFLLVFSIVLSLPACTDKDDIQVPQEESVPPEPDMALKLRGMAAPAATAPGASSQVALRVFQFDSEKLVSRSLLDTYDPTQISLVKGQTEFLYCVSGAAIDAEEGSSLSEFKKKTVSTGENSAPLFLSGWTSLDPNQMDCELTMIRSVARIDIDASEAEMEISEIIVNDAPAESYVFPGQNEHPADGGTVSYTHTFTSSPTGRENGVFMLFECDHEVNVTVKGSANGSAVEIPAAIPAVERNKVYTIRVFKKDTTVKASFSVADWEEGGIVSGNPDTTNNLTIDLANSVIPEGVKVDGLNNIIEVPGTGVSGMTVAFKTDLRVDVESVVLTGERVEVDQVQEKYVTISKSVAVSAADGVVSKINVNIESQLKGRPEYEIKIGLRKMNMSTSYDDLIIKVAESPYQIQTVKMGGVTWMAFNAVSSDLSEQIYPEIGVTVEQTYRQQWAKSIGNFFQYGKIQGYSPWTANDPNASSDIEKNIPWTNPESMPLPPGYHVATTAEWLKLLPAGTTLPSTYTAANGERIKAEVVALDGYLTDSPSEAANKAKLLKRYLRFESLDSGNVLIFPICAMKKPEKAEYPGGGNAMHAWVSFWIAEDRYTWLFRIGSSNGNLTATQGRDRWSYDGFMAVRGVKD